MHRVKISVGQKFGRLTVIREAGKRGNHHYWECVCDCGRHVTSRDFYLIRHKTPMCFWCAQSSKSEDIIGKTYGKVTVLERTERKMSSGAYYYRCRCIHGNELELPRYRIVNSVKFDHCVCQRAPRITGPYAIRVILQKARNGDEEAINKLITHYEPMIKTQIQYWLDKYKPRVFDYDDLMQVGRIAVWRELQTEDENSFFPNVARRVSWNVRREMVKYENSLSFSGDTEEKEYASVDIVPLNSTNFNTDTTDVNTLILQMTAKEVLEEMQTTLTPREYEIMYYLYINDMTKVAVARKLGLSHERVRQISVKAGRKIREKLGKELYE